MNKARITNGRTGSITLKNGPLSYLDWTRTPLVVWPFANFPSGCLKYFDLSDLIRSLGKRVTLVRPWGPAMRPYTKSQQARAINGASLSGIRIT